MTFVFKHPKYYKELRSRNKLDQAISLRESETSAGERSPGPGLKLDVPAPAGPSVKPQATNDTTASGLKLQATSSRLQASSAKLTKQQATSVKPRG